ncbi:MAG: Rpn family recombination-promoting nuclease/putative transposase, partial [Dysgonamonadaceae bacterium]|nr:Rpn family recombination-promoting nuclease/putative transposase [Dysgonamonadaceae bacterium]
MENFTHHSKYLNPLTDFGFHKLFGTEAYKELLIDFLNEVIQEEGEITGLEYLPESHWGPKKEDRSAVFDIYCKNEFGYFIVEMQIARQTYFKDRCVYYSTFPIQEQALKGEKWKYKLTPVYTIAILDFEPLDEQPGYYHEVKLIDVRTKEVFYDKLTYFFLELRKFNKRQDELVSNFERWIYLLKHLSRLENRPV